MDFLPRPYNWVAFLVLNDDRLTDQTIVVVRNGIRIERAVAAGVYSMAVNAFQQLRQDGVLRVVIHCAARSIDAVQTVATQTWGPAIVNATSTAFVNIMDTPRVLSDEIVAALVGQDVLLEQPSHATAVRPNEESDANAAMEEVEEEEAIVEDLLRGMTDGDVVDMLQRTVDDVDDVDEIPNLGEADGARELDGDVELWGKAGNNQDMGVDVENMDKMPGLEEGDGAGDPEVENNSDEGDGKKQCSRLTQRNERCKNMSGPRTIGPYDCGRHG